MYYYYVFAHLLLKFDHSFPLWYKKSKPKVQGDLIVLYLLSELGLFISVLSPVNYSKKRLTGQNYIKSYKFSTRTALANYTGIQLATASTSIVSTWKPRPNASNALLISEWRLALKTKIKYKIHEAKIPMNKAQFPPPLFFNKHHYSFLVKKTMKNLCDFQLIVEIDSLALPCFFPFSRLGFGEIWGKG